MKPLSQRSSIAFYPFGQGAVLHRQGSRELWVLNAPAATVWCLLDQTDGSHQLAAEYARRFKLDPQKARQEVESLLDTFAQLQNLQNTSIPGESERRPSFLFPDPLSAASRGSPASGRSDHHFTVAGRNFTLRCSHAPTAKHWHEMMAPLTGKNTSGGPPAELLVSPDPADPGRRLTGWKDHRLTAGGLLPENIVPHLIRQVFDHTCTGKSERLLLHAAVLSRRQKTFVFAAPSGAGKSTLAAALGVCGWTYLSDELAIIDPHTAQVEPYPMPICIKEASTAPLDALVPDLPATPCHTRTDGRRVRYWMPPQVLTAGSFPVAALVFPHYQPGRGAHLQPVEPLEALRKLAATGSSDRPLTPADIKALLSLARGPSFELTFDDLKSAVEALDQIAAVGSTR
jgi:hypothetical protein